MCFLIKLVEKTQILKTFGEKSKFPDYLLENEGQLGGAQSFDFVLKNGKKNFVESSLQLRSKERVKALFCSFLKEILVLRLLESSI